MSHLIIVENTDFLQVRNNSEIRFSKFTTCFRKFSSKIKVFTIVDFNTVEINSPLIDFLLFYIVNENDVDRQEKL